MTKPDLNDALYIVGLVLMLAGAIAIDWRLAMFAGGAVLVLTAIAATRRK